VRERRSVSDALAAAAKPRSDTASFGQGFVVGATNPKTIIFLAAVLPQFVGRTGGDVAAQILVLGVIFAAIAIVSDTLWVLGAGALRSWFVRSPRRLELVGGVGGLAIAAVGVGFLVTGRKD
jgi:threonine/homoserine/homoserine lactone efflux protein